MSELAILTLVYAPDVELCAMLTDSLHRYAPADTRPQLIVPAEDVPLFELFRECDVRAEREVLPSWFCLVPRLARLTSHLPPALHVPRVVAINRHRPLPPIRGWILQQIVKIAAAAAADSELVVLIDSDVELVRPIGASTFAGPNGLTLYRNPSAVTADLPQHILWHRTARRLLGLPAGEPPYDDYISSMTAWESAVVRKLIGFIESRHGRPWQDVVARELHFSEWTLYGVFVDEVLGRRDDPDAHRSSPLCLEWWGRDPLTPRGTAAFVSQLGADDVAVMISAKSGTSAEVRNEVRRRIRKGQETAHVDPSS